jgi:hypothetical protein
MSNTTPDVILVVPPLSPSDTNPPLGPYLLRTCLERVGLVAAVSDLSIAYIRSFGESDSTQRMPVLGDQDKDRVLLARAKRAFLSQTPFASTQSIALPCCGNAVTGMHFGFDGVSRAVHAASEPLHPWSRFVGEHLFERFAAPGVLGLSIMGPPQVFVAMVVARMARLLWPTTVVIAGGSHVTLLRDQIAQESRYGEFFDAFMPGHCERQLVRFAQVVRNGGDWRSCPGVIVAGNAKLGDACSAPSPVVEFSVRGRPAESAIEFLPTFDAEDLSPFCPSRITLPLQLARGCLYGRCRMCTYPATEPGFSGYPDWKRVGEAIHELIRRHGIRRISFKDSFMVPAMLRSLADTLHDGQLQVEWSATTMLNPRLTPQLMKSLADAGCRTLEFGLETIWPQGQIMFDKIQPIEMVEQVVADTVKAGIVANINLIYGLPGESHEQARAQLRWFLDQQERYPGLITGSHNMLEINRASPLACTGSQFGVEITGIAPWAFSFAWSAPSWRPEFAFELERAIFAPSPTHQIVTLPRSDGAPLQMGTRHPATS